MIRETRFFGPIARLVSREACRPVMNTWAPSSANVSRRPTWWVATIEGMMLQLRMFRQ